MQLYGEKTMLHKNLALLLTTSALILAGCGDDGGTAGGDWVGEVYASSNSKNSTVVGEFGSYNECVEATKTEATSGVFNCGIK